MGKFDAIFGVTDSGTSRMTIINVKTDLPYVDQEGREAFIEIGHWQGPEARRYDVLNERKGGQLKPTADMTRAEIYNARKLAALTKSWYIVGEDGTPAELDCTPENAAILYSDQRWLYLQLFVHATQYANFSKSSEKN